MRVWEESGGSSRWAIIYCPKQGVRRTHKRWEHIKELLDVHQVPYDFVQTESAKSVGRLTKMMCQNGYETLIIVGGDAALNRALNGMLEMGDDIRQKICVGLIPNGRGNDFASFWGFNDENDEQTVQWLMARRVRKVDVGYIRCFREDDESTPVTHYFLNCVNVGLVANIMKLKYKTRNILGLSSLSYFASMFLLLFQRMKTHLQIQVNEDLFSKEVMNVCVGNCRGYGQTPNAIPYNGCLDMSIILPPTVGSLIQGLGLLFTGKFLNHKDVKAYRTTHPIHIDNVKNVKISADGHVLKDIAAPLEIGIKPEYINFIIPS